MMTARTSHLAALLTAVVGGIAALGGGALLISGANMLQTRDLGLGAVGLTIGLILLAALVVLPGIVCLALAWPIYRGRRGAIVAALSIASLHLLLALFVAFSAWTSSDGSGEALNILVLGVAAMPVVQVICLARSLAATRSTERQRGFQPIVGDPST